MRYYLNEIPYTPADAVNRAAAAFGSFSNAMATSNADYNGHIVAVNFKPMAASGPIWNAEYTWSGRNVIGRGSLESCLIAGVRYYERGALGSQVVVALSDPDGSEWNDGYSMPLAEQAALCEAHGYTATKAPEVYTELHRVAVDGYKWETDRQMNKPGMLQAAMQWIEDNPEGTYDQWRDFSFEWMQARRQAARA